VQLPATRPRWSRGGGHWGRLGPAWTGCARSRGSARAKTREKRD
jgi:hypothetical protein